MPLIPCIPVSGRRGDLRSGRTEYSKDGFRLLDDVPVKEALTSAYSATDKDEPIAILDTDAFRRKFLNTDVVKEIRIKGRELWLITYVENVDDVIDGMCGAYDRICIPTHTADDDTFLESADISDSVIPVVFVTKDGIALSDVSIESEKERMSALGFREFLVLNVDDVTLDYRIIADDN